MSLLVMVMAILCNFMVTIILRLVNPLVHGDGIKFIRDGRKLLAIFNGDIGGGNLSYLPISQGLEEA
jgi:hypothetical protein